MLGVTALVYGTAHRLLKRTALRGKAVALVPKPCQIHPRWHTYSPGKSGWFMPPAPSFSPIGYLQEPHQQRRGRGTRLGHQLGVVASQIGQPVEDRTDRG
jgi:hypothetical protein